MPPIPTQCPKCGEPWFLPELSPLRMHDCPGCREMFNLDELSPREEPGRSMDDSFFDPTDPVGIVTMFPPEDDDEMG